MMVLALMLGKTIYAQNNVGIGTNSPNASSVLDVTATDKGLLIPRVALVQTTNPSPVTSPATSLLVYNTATVNDVVPAFYYWDGSQWVQVGAGGGSSCVTLDEAYDCGGAGAGRTISATDGSVQINKTTDFATNNYALYSTVSSGTSSNPSAGVYVEHSGAQGVAVYGEITNASNAYSAIQGSSSSNQDNTSGLSGYFSGAAAGYGIYGTNTSTTAGSQAVFGLNQRTSGGWGIEGAGINGVYGRTNDAAGFGLVGYNYSAYNTDAQGGIAVEGQGNVGVMGESPSGNGAGVYGKNTSTSGTSDDVGVWGASNNGAGLYGEGGWIGLGVQGDAIITGNLSKGGGSFKIDDPRDPANKYLVHSFVESPDMMNVYNGNVVLDANGHATIELPSYNKILNKDFRYQLTAIGAAMPNLYVASKVEGNTFEIAGGIPNGEVSWQITGIRKDPWANAHRIVPEQEKVGREKGTYMHPELYGKSEEYSIFRSHSKKTNKLNTLKK